MIDVEDIPHSGVMLVIVYFKGYKDYFQNETRKHLRDKIPNIDKALELNIGLEASEFALMRHVDEYGKSKTIGVIQTYNYLGMTPDKFRMFFEDFTKSMDEGWASKMWNNYEFMIAEQVGGL